MGDMTRGALIFTGAAAATGVTVGVLAQKYAPVQETPATTPTIQASRIDGEIPLDASAVAWREAGSLKVALKPQQLASPMLEEATLDEMEVRALRTDRELGVLVRFASKQPGDLPGLASYGDAVAIQLPLRASGKQPPVTMGGPGQPVHIVRWSSIWQRDVDRGRSGVETIYPNVVRDVSPESVLPPRSARLYSPARAVGNPVAELRRRWPVEEAFAEGFGTLTALPEQRARAQGRHANDRWSVVISAPLDRSPSGDDIGEQLAVPIAFALWIGSDDNRGSRKHYADWIQCNLG